MKKFVTILIAMAMVFSVAEMTKNKLRMKNKAKNKAKFVYSAYLSNVQVS